MWKIYESKAARKSIERLPFHIAEKYMLWKAIVLASSPAGLVEQPGFKDHALSGQWDGCRASRLNQQYRVVYQVLADEVRVNVIDVNAHDYRRKK